MKERKYLHSVNRKQILFLLRTNNRFRQLIPSGSVTTKAVSRPSSTTGVCGTGDNDPTLLGGALQTADIENRQNQITRNITQELITEDLLTRKGKYFGSKGQHCCVHEDTDVLFRVIHRDSAILRNSAVPDDL